MIEKFSTIFDGLRAAYGTFKIENRNEKGKSCLICTFSPLTLNLPDLGRGSTTCPIQRMAINRFRHRFRDNLPKIRR